MWELGRSASLSSTFLQSMRERGVREREEGRGGAEGLWKCHHERLLSLLNWHPHSHERATNNLASQEPRLLVDHQHPLIFDPHRVTLFMTGTEPEK